MLQWAAGRAFPAHPALALRAGLESRPIIPPQIGTDAGRSIIVRPVGRKSRPMPQIKVPNIFVVARRMGGWQEALMKVHRVHRCQVLHSLDGAHCLPERALQPHAGSEGQTALGVGRSEQSEARRQYPTWEVVRSSMGGRTPRLTLASFSPSARRNYWTAGGLIRAQQPQKEREVVTVRPTRKGGAQR